RLGDEKAAGESSPRLPLSHVDIIHMFMLRMLVVSQSTPAPHPMMHVHRNRKRQYLLMCSSEEHVVSV
ncbi:MAG: hypothetical protein ACXV48_06820, partial [Halobacteriota archaeon]